MRKISREALKAKLDRGDDFKLVMTLSDWAFEAQHIPGSINVTRMQDADKYLDRNDEIVVYCSDESCIASQVAYNILLSKGYMNVWRYAGGLSDWAAASYHLDGIGL